MEPHTYLNTVKLPNMDNYHSSSIILIQPKDTAYVTAPNHILFLRLAWNNKDSNNKNIKYDDA